MYGKKAIIITAPSGSGKTTIVKFLLSRIPQLRFSISATSRERRGDETNKVDYYFLSPSEFKKKINSNEFIEWEEVYDTLYYGTLKSEVDRIWAEGYDVIFDVDVKGALNLKKYFKDKGLSLFIRVNDLDVLGDRLRRRGTEDEQSLQKRMEKAKFEMGFESNFDRVIVNESLEVAQAEAERIVRTFLNV